MSLPPLPGVYVVELLNDDPISVNADRPGIAERCIKVTRANCKYGRAVNLARRERDYYKTFGVQNVLFRYFAVTDRAAEVEALVGSRLEGHRLRGLTGKPNEWLQGISAQQVEMIVKEALSSIVQCAPVPQTPEVRIVSKNASVSPAEVVAAAQYLQGAGMPVSALRELHHFPQKTETFAATLRYFSKKRHIQTKNQLYGARLLHVARQHQSTGRSFSSLVVEALALHPK